MFTGLVEDVAVLVSRREMGRAGTLVVETALPTADIAIGDSIAVNGACLTVAAKPAPARLAFHTLSETLRRTNLGDVPPGGLLNLERAMRLDGRLGGHLVSGHVDATAAIRELRNADDDWVATLALPAELAPLAIPKGSIAINGISLTIAELGADRFSVHLIPHTWRQTNLRVAKVGDRVNLEADMIGKYILRQRQCDAGVSHVTLDALGEAGWDV